MEELGVPGTQCLGGAHSLQGSVDKPGLGPNFTQKNRAHRKVLGDMVCGLRER